MHQPSSVLASLRSDCVKRQPIPTKSTTLISSEIKRRERAVQKTRAFIMSVIKHVCMSCSIYELGNHEHPHQII